MRLAATLLSMWLLIARPISAQTGIVYDQARAQYWEAMAAARVQGLPALIRQLEAVTAAFPASPVKPLVFETILAVALLHPGSVPDDERRWQTMKSQLGSNPELARSVQRVEIFRAYLAKAGAGDAGPAGATLSDPVFEGSILGRLAQADAAFRLGEYDRAQDLARLAIELDPYSPLLANAYAVLGLCAAYEGQMASAARFLQQALAITPLETLRGSTQSLLATALRFLRPATAAAGNSVFQNIAVTRLAGIDGLKDPRTMLFSDGKYWLLDRERLLAISPSGGVTETRQLRRLEDFSPLRPTGFYFLAEKDIEIAGARMAQLSASVAGRTRLLDRLRSVALDPAGVPYVLDEDRGIFRVMSAAGTAAAAEQVNPTKGRMLRIDARGYIYLLTHDRKSVAVLSRSGSMLADIRPSSVGGKNPSIEHFALDLLNHLYILDTEGNSIQIFAINSLAGRLEVNPVVVITLEQRPQFKDLKVMAVSDTGEMALTGKNENSWVLFK